ncbi:MAG: FAD binding domain-containing protein [Bacillota bacterium]
MSLGYVLPESLSEASKFLREHKQDARIVAGGTDVMVQLRRGGIEGKGGPRWLVDITRIPGLAYIRAEGDVIRIGAMTTHAEIARSPLIRERSPLLAEACASIGSPQIRARGTIGGNIMNASPAADSIPAFVALSARVRLAGPEGVRDAAISDVFDGPYKTTVQPGEILVEVHFNALTAGWSSAFVKLGRREALAIARLSVAVVVERDSTGRVSRASIAPGACLPMPSRVAPAEAIVVGKVADEEVVKSAAREVAEEMVRRTGVRWSTEYKKPVVEALTRRAIWKALGVDAD